MKGQSLGPVPRRLVPEIHVVVGQTQFWGWGWGINSPGPGKSHWHLLISEIKLIVLFWNLTLPKVSYQTQYTQTRKWWHQVIPGKEKLCFRYYPLEKDNPKVLLTRVNATPP